MNAVIAQLAAPATLAISAAERFRAIGRNLTGNGIGPWLTLVLGLGLIAGLVTLFALSHRRDNAKQSWQRFRRRAERIGLGEEERALLGNIALSADLKDPEAVFASEEAFFRGMARMERAPDQPGPFPGEKLAVCGSCQYYRSLREKLGFTSEPADTPEPAGVSLGPIQPGTTLKVTRQAEPHDAEVILEAVDQGTGELMIGKRQDLAVRTGETWTLSFSEAGLLWEFSARVAAVKSETELLVRALSRASQSNRRRFLRVPVSRPAQIAAFPFSTDEASAKPPEFVPAQMVELGGPGVLLEANVEAKLRDRVLVVMELGGRRVEGLGVVRRAGSKSSPIAVELVGLNTAQVAELARQTNAFATAGAAEHADEEHPLPQDVAHG